MDHVAGLGVLQHRAADAEGLAQVLHRVAVELLGHDPRALRREGVVALAHEPVRAGGVAAGGAPAAVGDVDRDHVAEDVVLRVAGRHVLRRPAHDRAELDLPVGAVAAVRNHDGVAVAHHRAAAGLEEQIGHAALFAPPAHLGRPLFGARAFADVAVEVDRGVQNLARVHDGRPGPQFVDVVDEVGAVGAQPVGHHVVDDLVQPVLQAVLVAPDQLQHVFGHGDRRVVRVRLEGHVRDLDVDHQAVAQDDAHVRHAVDVERADLERLDRRHVGLGGGRPGVCERREQAEDQDSSHAVSSFLRNRARAAPVRVNRCTRRAEGCQGAQGAGPRTREPVYCSDSDSDRGAARGGGRGRGGCAGVDWGGCCGSSAAGRGRARRRTPAGSRRRCGCSSTATGATSTTCGARSPSSTTCATAATPTCTCWSRPRTAAAAASTPSTSSGSAGSPTGGSPTTTRRAAPTPTTRPAWGWPRCCGWASCTTSSTRRWPATSRSGPAGATGSARGSRAGGAAR